MTTLKLLATFVLTGTVDSTDKFFASVELNLNPPLAQASLAVIPLSAFPCEIREGDSFYVLKLTKETEPVIICGEYKSNDGD
jgi:hypothetical protein